MIFRFTVLATLVATMGCGAEPTVQEGPEADRQKLAESELTDQNMRRNALDKPVIAPEHTNAGLWPINVVTELPEVPTQVTLYTVVPNHPTVGMPQLREQFGFSGKVSLESDFGGVRHVVDGDVHAYVFADGAAQYHNTARIGSEKAIQPLSEEDIWQRATTLIRDLGLERVGPVTLEPADVGEMRVTRIDDPGLAGESWVTEQIATFDQQIDGLPAFGASQAEVIFGENGDVIGLSNTVRELAAAATLEVMRPEDAIAHFGDRAAETGRYNLYRAHILGVEAVSIEDVRLGYYVPHSMEGPKTYEPVYEIRGTVHGFDTDGNDTEIDLLWVEPAVVGHGLDALRIDAR